MEEPIVWSKGIPPHIGWWNASVCRNASTLRWWDGKAWSTAVSFLCAIEKVEEYASQNAGSDSGLIEWSNFYPKGARVPRVNPRVDGSVDHFAISKALALAIGYSPEHVYANNIGVRVCRPYKTTLHMTINEWFSFDYRNWNVISPIAEKFDCFPFRKKNTWWSWSGITNVTASADTPQKAIALAVIEGAKK